MKAIAAILLGACAAATAQTPAPGRAVQGFGPPTTAHAGAPGRVAQVSEPAPANAPHAAERYLSAYERSSLEERLVHRIMAPPMTVRVVGSNARPLPPPDAVAQAAQLLAQGANPNYVYQGKTLLMLAIDAPSATEKMADLLFEHGGRIVFDEVALSPGAISKLSVRAHTKEDLETLDAQPDHAGQLTGMRIGPLSWTALHTRPEIGVRQLARDGLTAADRNVAYFAAAGSAWDLLLAVLPYHADVDAADRAGVTALMFAADAGRADVVRALLKAGASVNARSAAHWPPALDVLTTDGVAGLLVGHYPQPRLVGGLTALGIASQAGDKELVKILAQAGGRW